MNQRLRNLPLWKQHLFSLLFSIMCIGAATVPALLYRAVLPESSSSILLIFLLAVMVVSRYTAGCWHGLASCLFSTLWFNYCFASPGFHLDLALADRFLTFLIMLLITAFTCAMSSTLTTQADKIEKCEKQLSGMDIEKMRANLLRAISHDLRTPLTGIIGSSSAFLESGSRLSESEKQKLVANIYEDSSWLLNVVENLLTITRIRGDNLSITTSEESVEEVISESLQKIKKRYPDAKIRVKIPEDLIMLPMDAVLIEQVTINIVSNAIVHSESSEPVDIIIRGTPHAVSFTIKDYGTGIPPAKLQSLFENTPGSSQASDAYKGMGIGLSICKTIIAAHHGTILCRNHRQGAEFVFTLPRI